MPYFVESVFSSLVIIWEDEGVTCDKITSNLPSFNTRELITTSSFLHVIKSFSQKNNNNNA